MAAGLSKMLRRFSIDTAGSHNKVNKSNFNQEIMDQDCDQKNPVDKDGDDLTFPNYIQYKVR